MRLRRRDGAIQKTYHVGNLPVRFLFDGSSIWVTNYTGDSVTKITPNR